jgi:hypothetical protein
MGALLFCRSRFLGYLIIEHKLHKVVSCFLDSERQPALSDLPDVIARLVIPAKQCWWGALSSLIPLMLCTCAGHERDVARLGQLLRCHRTCWQRLHKINRSSSPNKWSISGQRSCGRQRPRHPTRPETSLSDPSSKLRPL